jgi:hypothetical protein
MIPQAGGSAAADSPAPGEPAAVAESAGPGEPAKAAGLPRTGVSPPSPESQGPPGPRGPAAPAGPGGRRALSALLAIMAAWAGWFIFRTSFVLDGRRLFCLFDDAMISMTYARNLVEGYGLNWARRGAPVEGFTHPLWTALMVPVNLLPIGLDRRSLMVQIAGAALLLLHVVLVRRLVLRHFTRPGACHWLPACMLTAFYYPLNFWSLAGMETALQAVLTTASVLVALDIVYGRRDRHLALLLLGTLAVLLRMDMAPLVIAVQVYILAHGGLRQGERADRRGLLRYPGWLLGVLVLVLAATGYAAFRWSYFHDLLPNTYYLKLGGIPLAVRLTRGGSVLLDTFRAHGPLLLAVGLGAVPQLWWRRHDGRDDGDWRRRLALPAIVFGLCCAYSAFVGGDAWEDDVRANRFVAFAMPMVFVLFNALCNQAMSAMRAPAATAATPAEGRRPPPALDDAGSGPAAALRGGPLALRYALATVTVGAVLVANGLWLQESTDANWNTFAVFTRPFHVNQNQEVLGKLRSLQKIADPGAAVAVTSAGITAYFSDFKMIDELGSNDRHIARGRPAVDLDEDDPDPFVPGYVKWDMAYVAEEQDPDVWLQTWGGRQTVTVLRSHGYRRRGDLWIDPSSPRLHLQTADPGEPAPAGGGAEPGPR